MSASRYETHVTVHRPGPDEPAGLRGWADTAGLELTHLALSRGRMRQHYVTEYPSFEHDVRVSGERLARAVAAAFGGA
ncbi:hypothetical protein SHKM778_76590 [Streptomyces sp. KM77-8]|uniref:Uncharacterized protein n=1 Tax=Streptomyces haneummycinicus TaxID=3074435 RepID=A0AAT9HUD2_9ACTN